MGLATEPSRDARPGEGDAAALLEAYRRHLATSRGLSDATIRNYLADLAPFLQYLERERMPISARPTELRRFVERDERRAGGGYRGLVRDYVSWLLEERPLRSGRRAGGRGHARASVLRQLAALRSFMRYLIERKLMPASPMWAPGSTLMRRFTPRPARRLPDVVSAPEAARIVEAPTTTAPGPRPGQAATRARDHALLELLYSSGLRVSEAEGMNVSDVALGARTVRLWGKGSKARMAPLSNPAVRALRRYLSDARPSLQTNASNAALFLNHRGGRLTRRTIQALVKRYAAAVGADDGVHTHTLRHSFATHLLDGGADLRIVQELLGHSTPSATQVYTHISQAEARRVYLAAHPLAKSS